MQLNKITTTVGLNIGKIITHGVKLMFWDLGGQEELQVRSDPRSKVNKIYFVDCAKQDSFILNCAFYENCLYFYGALPETPYSGRVHTPEMIQTCD